MKFISIVCGILAVCGVAIAQSVGGFSTINPPATTYLWAGYLPTANVLTMMVGDGQRWATWPSTYTPNGSDIVRDPSLMKLGGKYWIAHTSSLTKTTSFDFASSIDGHAFTYLAAVDCSGASGNGANAAVWAPKWFVDDDGSVHVIFGSSTNSGSSPFSAWEVHTTSDLVTNGAATTWSAPVQISGTGLPSNYYDPSMIKVGGIYYIVYVNNTGSRNTNMMSSSSLTSGYTITQSGNWWNETAGGEGPHLINTTGNTYEGYFDNDFSGNSGIYFTISTAGINGPYSMPVPFTSPYTNKHGSMIHN